MRKILTSFSLVAASLAFAQVGINADESDIATDAVFHVKNKNGEAKGVVLPSVSLDSTTDQASIAGGSVTTGLMVWNDGAKGLKPAGYYYWDSAKWVLTGNVDSSNPFLANTKGNIRVINGDILSSTWEDTDFALVATQATTQILLPPAQSNKNRIISVNNQKNGTINYTGSTGYYPVNNSSIRSGKGDLLMSDGQNWYKIGGF